MLERNFFSRITNLSPSVQKTLEYLKKPENETLREWVEDNTHEGMPADPVLEALAAVLELQPILGKLSATDLWDTVMWVGQLSEHPTPEERQAEKDEVWYIAEIIDILRRKENWAVLAQYEGRSGSLVSDSVKVLVRCPDINMIRKEMGSEAFERMMHNLSDPLHRLQREIFAPPA